ncbi:hypothetical protein [Paenibacillus macquariensis]|uniref:DUF5348 domain-containing protein n=1 Tax=Paenibacillus macquariensis TaxID=948756 RepID=A0ABY1K1E8_9BACL|nr:hypothetical protein [Paenibacillus macquariensis]MEC0091784.1 hypothetical protein [Paenibacillus macquariensis]SIR12044.1 hypothetical protein SAMN05421578_107131 [Paenibacillus macquariensis]
MSNYGADFQKGDIIEYCEEQFEVLVNDGNSGTVKEYPDGDVIGNFRWDVYGVKCIKIG